MKNNAGFTMIEVIVIVAVIAILGGILTPMVIKEIGKSKFTRAAADMEAISTAFSQYYADTSFWPEKYQGTTNQKVSFEDFRCLYANTETLGGWDGPYMKRGVLSSGERVVALKNGANWEGIVDPWGSPFRIVYGRVGSGAGGAGGGIAVLSAGPDGTFDTNDKKALAGVPSKDDLLQVVTSKVR